MMRFVYFTLNKTQRDRCNYHLPCSEVMHALGYWWSFINRNYVVWPIFLMNVFIALKGTHFSWLKLAQWVHFCDKFFSWVGSIWIRAVAGQRSSPELSFANKTKMFFRAKNKRRKITGLWNIGHCDLNLLWGQRHIFQKYDIHPSNTI